MSPDTEFARDFCAGIGPLQLGVVLVVFSIYFRNSDGDAVHRKVQYFKRINWCPPKQLNFIIYFVLPLSQPSQAPVRTAGGETVTIQSQGSQQVRGSAVSTVVQPSTLQRPPRPTVIGQPAAPTSQSSSSIPTTNSPAVPPFEMSMWILFSCTQWVVH